MSQAPVAVIMGVGVGLGASIARRFAREGFAVGLMARKTESLAAIQAQITQAGSVALAIPTDVTDQAMVVDAFEQVRSQLGSPTVLVYNAAQFLRASLLDITPDQFESAWKANCFGAFLGAQQVLPDMVAQQRGTILLTGATAALRGSAGFAGMAVGKFGLRALSQSLAREFGPQGIHVAHVIIDGMIDTDWVRAMVPDKADHTFLRPDAIAETYWQLYRQDPSAWTLELDLRPAVETF
ncbi:MAG: SDR family NAD(P)-dependent oxidoreductase [Cyanobacteria bacterium J06638_22]